MDQKEQERQFRFKELIKLSNRVSDYLPFPDYTHKIENFKSDVCGDVMSVYIKQENGVIVRVGIEGQACTVSRAVMVKTADYMVNKPIGSLTRENLLNVAIDLGFNPSSTRASCAQFPSIVVLKAVS